MPLTSVAQALLTRGLALQSEGQPAQAIRCYQEVLARDAHNVDALQLLGLIAHDCGDNLAAAELIESAIKYCESDPPAELYANLGPIYRALGRWDETTAVLETAIRLKPELLEARANLIQHMDVLSNDPFHQLALRREYSWQLGHSHITPPYPTNLDPNRPLTIGYVSGNFTMHSAAFSFRDIVTQHNEGYKAILFSTNQLDDPFTPYFRENVTYHDVKDLTDLQLARFITECGVDILIDLAGHTPGGRLATFARKPAPIQISAWGYAVGTGLWEMDYLITDRIHCPNDARAILTEQPLYLSTFMCHSPSPMLPAFVKRPKRPFTFGYFGNPRKLSPACLDMWGHLLKERPETRLILKYEGFELSYTQEWVLKGLGIDPSRVQFFGKTPHAAHLAGYGLIDCALDSWPHGGGVTTLEALCCGVPVLTRQGDTLPSRTGASILRAVCLPKYITKSAFDFVWQGTLLVDAKPLVRETRETIRAQTLASGICNPTSYREEVESVYREIWKGYCGDHSH